MNRFEQKAYTRPGGGCAELQAIWEKHFVKYDMHAGTAHLPTKVKKDNVKSLAKSKSTSSSDLLQHQKQSNGWL
jgi:hypothetical protein